MTLQDAKDKTTLCRLNYTCLDEFSLIPLCDVVKKKDNYLIVIKKDYAFKYCCYSLDLTDDDGSLVKTCHCPVYIHNYDSKHN